MAQSTNNQSSPALDLETFKENVDAVAKHLRLLSERSPYLELLYAATSSAYTVIPDEPETESLKEFVTKAALVAPEEWNEISIKFEAANEKLESFTLVAEELLERIKKVDPSGTGYDKVEKYFKRAEAATNRFRTRFDEVFDYFNKYGRYLSQDIGLSKVEGLVREAQSTATVAKDLAEKQRKQLDSTGALSRSNVYYELAYGQKVPRITQSGSGKFIFWLKRVDAWLWHRRGYRQVARWWLAGVLLSVVVSSVYAYYLYHNLGIDFARPAVEVAVLVFIKLLIIFPLIYLIKFCVHSYRVNKHLEVMYTHRWALHQTLDSYLEIAKNKEGGVSKVRSAQLAQITPFFFRDIETGYVTKKEGLGDKSIEIIPEGVFQMVKKKE